MNPRFKQGDIVRDKNKAQFLIEYVNIYTCYISLKLVGGKYNGLVFNTEQMNTAEMKPIEVYNEWCKNLWPNTHGINTWRQLNAT